MSRCYPQAMQIERHEIRVFSAVVEEGGFSRAAERLNISQPAVSQAINLLAVRRRLTRMDVVCIIGGITSGALTWIEARRGKEAMMPGSSERKFALRKSWSAVTCSSKDEPVQG